MEWNTGMTNFAFMRMCTCFPVRIHAARGAASYYTVYELLNMDNRLQSSLHAISINAFQ